MNWETVGKIAIPAGIMLAALLAGWIFQGLISRRLRGAPKTDPVHWQNVLVRALRGVVFVWSLLAGAAILLKTVALPAEVLHTLHRFLVVAAIFTGTLFLARFSRGVAGSYLNQAAGTPTAILRTILTLVAYLLGFLIILDYLGISITPIITALGVGGLAVALALQDTLSNLFSGIHILMTGKIKPGEYIKLQSGEEGYVTDISWRSTTIRALPNNIIIIPNNKLAQSIVTNFHLPDKTMAVLVGVGVAYDSDLAQVERVTVDLAREVLREVPGGVPDFTPLVRFHTLGTSSIDFTVVLMAREFGDQFLIKHEFVKRLRKRFQAEGIKIPFPIRTVYLQNRSE
jgi:small-conductance mechanosensitive channel